MWLTLTFGCRFARWLWRLSRSLIYGWRWALCLGSSWVFLELASRVPAGAPARLTGCAAGLLGLGRLGGGAEPHRVPACVALRKCL